MSGTYTPAEGKGTIFKNDRKEKDSHPDWRGTAMIGGALVEIALWERDKGRGTFYSVAISPARDRQAAAPQAAREAPPGRGGAAENDEIPFSACKE